jgi:hypothetical protein
MPNNATVCHQIAPAYRTPMANGSAPAHRRGGRHRSGTTPREEPVIVARRATWNCHRHGVCRPAVLGFFLSNAAHKRLSRPGGNQSLDIVRAKRANPCLRNFCSE